MAASDATPGHIPLRLSDDLPEVDFQPRDYLKTGETVDSASEPVPAPVPSTSQPLPGATGLSATECIASLITAAAEILQRKLPSDYQLSTVERAILAGAREVCGELADSIAATIEPPASPPAKKKRSRKKTSAKVKK